MDSYTLHKLARKKFATQRVIVGGIAELEQADLMDMVGILAHNNGMRYILVVIDCFSRKAWAEPLKTKGGSDVVNAFKKIYQRTVTPENISSDRGQEFRNILVQNYFAEQDMVHILSYGNAKSQFVERLIRTLKALLWRYFSHNKTYKFYDILPRLMDEYNNRYHTSIHMSPNNVTAGNEKDVFMTLYGDLEQGVYNKQQSIFNVGDLVRISKWKHAFKKSYEENYTDEIFRVREVLRGPLAQYRLYDMNYESIMGKFYQDELVGVKEH